MGASTKILIGIEVLHSDFFVEKEVGFGCKFGCKKGHPGEVGRFCSHCGKETGPILKTVATEHLKKFCKALEISEEFAIANSPEIVISRTAMIELSIDSGRGLYMGSSDWSGESDGHPTCYVLGVSLLDTESADNDEVDRTSSVSIQKFIDAFRESSKLVAACGFNTDDVRIFQTKYLTY